MLDEDLTSIVRRMRKALFVTGAGISADSGLPTYRGVGGLYEDADTEDGVPIEVALSGATLMARPELAWRHLRRIEEACRGARPNRAHEIIAELEQRLDEVVVLTQNVDGFHSEAGSKRVIEIHGNVHRLICTKCRFEQRVADYSGLPPVPTCPDCGSVVRPGVVLFGEYLPVDALAAMADLDEVRWDAVFSIGTSSLFPYISAPVRRARWMGIPTVEINPGDTEVSHLTTYRLRVGAVAAMEAVRSALA